MGRAQSKAVARIEARQVATEVDNERTTHGGEGWFRRLCSLAATLATRHAVEDREGHRSDHREFMTAARHANWPRSTHAVRPPS
jgi:hypothetical protein